MIISRNLVSDSNYKAIEELVAVETSVSLPAHTDPDVVIKASGAYLGCLI